MTRNLRNRIGLSALLALSATGIFADIRFAARPMPGNVMPGRGVCEIHLQVDDTVEVVVDRDQVFVHNLSGQDARDEGSACNMPLPGREVDGFNFEIRESRTREIQLVEQPTRRNGGKAIVRIHDGPGGFGRYIFRISWALQGPPPPPDRRDDRRDGDRRPDGDRAMGDIRIIRASWGAPGPGQSRDITRLVQDRIRDGHIRLLASNEEIGFDPAYGTPKALVVEYEIRGRRQEVRIAEGQYLQLP